MSTRGRPRSFDRDDALARVMEVFWAKGYEGAQLNDLVSAIGITPPSFYAAFGSKEAAFHEAVDLYLATVAAGPRRVLQEAATARQGIRDALEESINVALSSKSGGCFLILGLINCLSENEGARAHLRAARQKTVAMLRERLERGVHEGDLSRDTDVDHLADFYNGIMQAISFQARDGATRKQLMALLEPAMNALGPVDTGE
ncbi:TetR/AcrR family transcriptional regulator [Pelagibacterium sp. H642]|uniref:TetR/AcrR family transcriptional regulator n=1 Tax=Pelagibacterium sp. H642 TaxID=1881069 RepID=UPI0028164688|nr:TetR/AcrR family transcriptional regulator [Pelagibacterium sp. H642]WMT92911.1 TetR/AcrR family transcriptional regulator [Pelagibacterium sp. H642]